MYVLIIDVPFVAGPAVLLESLEFVEFVFGISPRKESSQELSNRAGKAELNKINWM